MTSDTALSDVPATEGTPFVLPEALSIHTVESVAATLQEMVVPPYRLTVDVSHVEVMTTPGAQLLLALGTTLAQCGGGLTLHQPSAALIDTFQQLGLASQLESWGVQHG